MRNGHRGPKVLLVHLLDDFSGASRICLNVASVLAEAGMRPDLMVSSAGTDGFLRRDLGIMPSFFYRIGAGSIAKAVYLAAAQLALGARVFTYCLKHRPDLVYVSTVLPSSALVAARLCGTPSVCHVHETSLGSPLLFRLCRYVAKQFSSRQIVVSDYAARELGFELGRCTVVHNALAEADWRTAAAVASSRRSGPHSPFCVMMATSLKSYKGIDSFVEIAASLRRRPGVRFRLILNAEPAEFLAFSRKHDLPNMSMVRRPPSIYEEFSEADLVVNLSHPEACVETFGMTLLEAMCCGVPVVSPLVGGCLELFEEGKGGWRRGSRDIAGIVSLIEKLADNPVLWSSMSSAARAAAQRFAPERFSAHVLAALELCPDAGELR